MLKIIIFSVSKNRLYCRFKLDANHINNLQQLIYWQKTISSSKGLHTRTIKTELDIKNKIRSYKITFFIGLDK